MARKKIVLRIPTEGFAGHGVDFSAIPQHTKEDLARSIYRDTNKFRDLPDRESPEFLAQIPFCQKAHEDFLRDNPDWPEELARMRERILQGGEV